MRKRSHKGGAVGFGQLTLVEHSLCPLDPESALRPHLVHEPEYFFTDKNRHTCRSKAQVFCPEGLSPIDEFYLWGLLALTLRQPQPDIEFHATPHFCLRELGLIDEGARRGGRQYQQFSDAVRRLSLVRYRNDHFYDPIRAEHRRVSFGFFSYSLPLDPESSRAWRFVWDPLFFELVKPTGGKLIFDLETYRQFDVAGRRLFLLLEKIFRRRAETHAFG